jgi:hypothetical protein
VLSHESRVVKHATLPLVTNVWRRQESTLRAGDNKRREGGL